MNFICEWLFTAIKDNKSLIAYQLGANRMCSVDLFSEMLALIILTFFALLTRDKNCLLAAKIQGRLVNTQLCQKYLHTKFNE